MRELASGVGNWLSPLLPGNAVATDSLAAYWLGALAIKVFPFLDSAVAARIPFILLLALALLSTWYAIYYLARSPLAQPVAFAFGGEAAPVDYARAMADAGLLALIACLGLAQLSHETTPALAQLGFSSLLFYALASSSYRRASSIIGPALGLVVGLVGLTLSGAPTVALLMGVGGLAIQWAHLKWGGIDEVSNTRDIDQAPERQHSLNWSILLIGTITLGGLLASFFDLWRWRVQLPGLGTQTAWADWTRLGRLLLWFAWPVWPLALWTLWRWRGQLASRHVALPLWFAGVSVLATLTTPAADRSLLLSLPPLAALAAFALPTFKRSVASLIDWFTLLFFSGCGIVVWIVWIAMQTGVPRQPAANVAKLAPGFQPEFSAFSFFVALAATLAWGWLVRWRAGSHPTAIWKSLVLPAGGTTLCWLLLMTLWLPLLDYARSYGAISRQIAGLVNKSACVEIYGISAAQAAALQYHGGLSLVPAKRNGVCPYLVVDADEQAGMSRVVNMPDWAFQATLRRPTDKTENVLLFKRVSGSAAVPRNP